MYNDDDIEMMGWEQLGRESDAAHRKVARLRDTDPMTAAKACLHSGGFPLDSVAAINDKDPRAGEVGFRCLDCGSVLAVDPFDVTDLYPCEIEILFPCEGIGAEMTP